MPGASAGQAWPVLDAGQRTDAGMRRDVRLALTLDSLIPLTVDARVQDRVVTLTGTVSSHGARDVAMFLVGCVPGVLGIRNEITVTPAGEDRV
jgi:osmotically-inducible protein OsmY